MTVKQAMALTNKLRRGDVLIDARDVLDKLYELAGMYEEEEQDYGLTPREYRKPLEFAAREIEWMNVDIPYRVEVVNSEGGIETFVPEEV